MLPGEKPESQFPGESQRRLQGHFLTLFPLRLHHQYRQSRCADDQPETAQQEEQIEVGVFNGIEGGQSFRCRANHRSPVAETVFQQPGQCVCDASRHIHEDRPNPRSGGEKHPDQAV